MLLKFTTLPMTTESDTRMAAGDPSRLPQPILINPHTVREVRPRLMYKMRDRTPEPGQLASREPYYAIEGCVITHGSGEEGVAVVTESFQTVWDMIKDAIR